MLPHDARFGRALTQPDDHCSRTEDRPEIWNVVTLINGRSLLYEQSLRSLMILPSFILSVLSTFPNHALPPHILHDPHQCVARCVGIS